VQPPIKKARRSSTAGVLAGERWNSLTQPRLPVAKAPAEDLLVGQGPKLGYRLRLETVVVPTTNFADWQCAPLLFGRGGVRGLGESIVFESLGEYARKSET